MKLLDCASAFVRVLCLPAMLAAASLLGCAAPPPADLIMNVDQCKAAKRIAVLPFSDGPGNEGLRSGDAVAGIITERFAQNPVYKLVERSKLKAVLDEQDMKTAGLVDAEMAQKVGKLVGVDAVVTGTVSQYDQDKTTMTIYMVPVNIRRYKVGVSLRVIDVASGDVIYAYSDSGESDKDYVLAGKDCAKKLLDPLFLKVRGG